MVFDKTLHLERCASFPDDIIEPDRTINIMQRQQVQELSDKQAEDYYEYRKPFLTYLLRQGKDPEKAKGYSAYTVANTADRTAAFDNWVWEKDAYRIPPDEEDAEEYMEAVAFRDVTESTKGKIQEALLRYSSWLEYKFDINPWEFDWTFQSGGGNNGPRDFLTKSERQKIRRAAMEKDRESSWKFTSIVWVSLDAGLRPVEVGNAKVSWCDTENQVLRIPREDSAKNSGNWAVSITERTANALDHWLEERSEHPRYEDTDKLWLTRQGNRYGSHQLKRLLKRLCDKAGIDYENRSMSWYSIRHSVGTLMAEERDLAATKAQLRHQSVQTSMKYDNVPVGDRRDALDKMG